MSVELALVVAAVAGAVSAQQSHKAAKAQNKASERAANLERARALSEQSSRNRRAVAERRRRTAEIIASAQAENSGSNSAVSGAVSAIGSDTASNIGSNQINLAANIGQSLLLQRGNRQALRFQKRAAIAGVVSDTAGSYAGYQSGQKKLTSGNTGTTKTS